MEHEAGTALVTGASSGIGAEFARQLARRGHDLIVVARRRDRLEELAEEVTAETGVAVSVLVADLTDGVQLASVEAAAAASASLDVLVNCAGVAGYMPFLELPADQAEAMVGLHIVAPVRVTRAALPGMIARAHGTVINVSSGLSFTGAIPSPPLPKRAVYAAAKAYLNTFSEILADELRGTGVSVQAFCPGAVHTELHASDGLDLSNVKMMTAADVVTASLAAIALGETVCVPALADPALLAAFDESRRNIFVGLINATLAPRYQP